LTWQLKIDIIYISKREQRNELSTTQVEIWA